MAELHKFEFNGAILSRGFWLYVWEITPPSNAKLYYVGRTGDSSSNNAQSPFNRMGQHLGFNFRSNVLRRHLEKHKINPEDCTFQLLSFGPIFIEAKTKDEHIGKRDDVAAMEKALAEYLAEAGCQVINTVNCRKALNENLFKEVRVAFAKHLPALALINK